MVSALVEDKWVRRYRWHMEAIPELLQLARGGVVPLRAVQYGERVSGGSDVRRLPFSADAVDDADNLWALLVLYAREVSELLGGSSPFVIRSRVWSTREAQGLPPNLSPAGAWALGDEVARWLADRALSIAEYAQLADSEEHLFAAVRALRSRYGLDDRVRTRRRLCTVCGAHGVVASYSDVGGVEYSRVWCVACGHEVEGVMKVDGSHIPAGGGSRRTVGQDDQAVASTRA